MDNYYQARVLWITELDEYMDKNFPEVNFVVKHKKEFYRGDNPPNSVNILNPTEEELRDAIDALESKGFEKLGIYV